MSTAGPWEAPDGEVNVRPGSVAVSVFLSHVQPRRDRCRGLGKTQEKGALVIKRTHWRSVSAAQKLRGCEMRRGTHRSCQVQKSPSFSQK